MEAIIHYIKSGRSFGPVTVQDFLDLLETHVIAEGDQVRIEGESGWSRAGDLADQIRSGRPPIARGSKRPPSVIPAGGFTVFTSAPPIIPRGAPIPREHLPAASCPTCAAPVGEGARFCKQCGGTLTAQRCSACQHDNSADARFCEHCGHKLAAPVTR